MSRDRKKLRSELKDLLMYRFSTSFHFSSESESSDSQRSSTGKDFEMLDAEEDEEN